MSADEPITSIRQRAKEPFRLTAHAVREMDRDGYTTQDVLDGLLSGTILESYPNDRRGPSCLLGGVTVAKRPIHVVCTTTEPLIVITVYEPVPPKWPTPTERRQGT